MPDLGPLESIVEDAVGDMDLVSNSSKDTMTSIKDSDAINMDISGMMGDVSGNCYIRVKKRQTFYYTRLLKRYFTILIVLIINAFLCPVR